MQLAMPHRTIIDYANGCNKNVAQVVEDDGLKKKKKQKRREWEHPIPVCQTNAEKVAATSHQK